MQNKELIKKGAEAELTSERREETIVLVKKRVPKNYRNKELDEQIRKKRTRSEAKLLKEASSVANVPKIISVNEKKAEIVMEFIEGKQLKEIISEKKELCEEAGEKIRALHNIGIIHGDLTTSNIIYAEEKKADEELRERIKRKGLLFFIDFGLGYFSNKTEDKATDLVVFKKTFNATHSSIKDGWQLVMQGYKPEKETEERMKAIEKRARYH
jgi:Kae1-associated kinase Bud32